MKHAVYKFMKNLATELICTHMKISTPLKFIIISPQSNNSRKNFYGYT